MLPNVNSCRKGDLNKRYFAKLIMGNFGSKLSHVTLRLKAILQPQGLSVGGLNG